MTNAQIIFNEAQRLADLGLIKYTGNEFKVEDACGNVIVCKETEDIHTYQVWKKLGFQVQRGQKAVTKLQIWKYTAKENEETGETDERMFMKVAAFFSRSQVEKIA